MNTTLSKDGTSIAFDRAGSGPPVVLVRGELGEQEHIVDELTRLLDLLPRLGKQLVAIDIRQPGDLEKRRDRGEHLGGLSGRCSR